MELHHATTVGSSSGGTGQTLNGFLIQMLSDSEISNRRDNFMFSVVNCVFKCLIYLKVTCFRGRCLFPSKRQQDLRASAQFEHKLSQSEHKQGLLNESSTKSDFTINKLNRPNS